MYYRSQHENQSWLAMLTTILDTCALLLTGIEGTSEQTARFTFAIARHATVDLTNVTGVNPGGKALPADRLPSMTSPSSARCCKITTCIFASPNNRAATEAIRGLYEPYLFALSRRLMISLPHWLPNETVIDDWETSAWDHMPKHMLPSKLKRDKLAYKHKHKHVDGVTH